MHHFPTTILARCSVQSTLLYICSKATATLMHFALYPQGSKCSAPWNYEPKLLYYWQPELWRSHNISIVFLLRLYTIVGRTRWITREQSLYACVGFGVVHCEPSQRESSTVALSVEGNMPTNQPTNFSDKTRGAGHSRGCTFNDWPLLLYVKQINVYLCGQNDPKRRFHETENREAWAFDRVDVWQNS